jgi:hypothetical protein
VYRAQRIALIIPALNEEQAIGGVIASLPDWLDEVVVVDNGSTDQTAAIAADHGATVVHEPRRGYGAACLAGLTHLAFGHRPDIVAFMDADRSDDPADLPALLEPIVSGSADMVIGSRVLGKADPGSLTLPQRFGNALATGLLRRLWGVQCTDLGPFRAIRFDHLARLRMDDLGYGWTVQMQARAAAAGYRVAEVPATYRRRIGKSKISGTVRGVVGAGTKILSTIARERLLRPLHGIERNRIIVFSRLPQPGNTKTRMIPALGREGAADLQRQMTRRTLATVDRTASLIGCESEVRHVGGTSEQMADVFGSSRRYVSQGESDLGEKLQRAFSDAFTDGIRGVICVGSDCPSISHDLLSEALRRLADHDLVIGPATDGGYYLIGMNQPQPDLFVGIDWGTERVLAQTLARAESLGLRVHQLAELSDVDEPCDLEHWHQVGAGGDAESRPWLSVIIPTLNEESSIVDAIRSARQCPGVEIIVADGGSTDATRQLARDHGAKVIQCELGRGRQLACGADEANGDVLLFLHADTRLPFGYASELRRTLSKPNCIAGAFRMAFDRVNTSLCLVEWGTDLRSTWRQMPYGDQAIYLRRSTYRRLGGFRPLDAMEDFDLVWRLRRLGTVHVSRLPAVTSARKYMTRGPWRTVLQHQWMIWSWLWWNRRRRERNSASRSVPPTPTGVYD